MNKYEKAINYFYSVMEKGNIRNDAEQESFETAINVLERENKVSKIAEQYTNPNKYYIGDIVPNLGKINHINREDNVILYELVNEYGNVTIRTEKEIEEIMTEYYKFR